MEGISIIGFFEVSAIITATEQVYIFTKRPSVPDSVLDIWGPSGREGKVISICRNLGETYELFFVIENLHRLVYLGHCLPIMW